MDKLELIKQSIIIMRDNAQQYAPWADEYNNNGYKFQMGKVEACNEILEMIERVEK